MKYKILPQKNSQRVNSTKTRIKTKNLLLFIKKILYLQRHFTFEVHNIYKVKFTNKGYIFTIY